MQTHTHANTHDGTFQTHSVDIIPFSRALRSERWPSGGLSGNKIKKVVGLYTKKKKNFIQDLEPNLSRL